MLRVVYDNFLLVVIAVAAALYLLIRLAKLRRVPVITDGVPGLATALSTGLLGAALLTVASVVLFPLAWLENRRRLVEWIGPAFLYVAGLVALGVLIVYAIWPARPGDRAGAGGRALAGFFLVLVTVIPIDGAISSAVRREADAQRLQAEADEQQAILDRSAALSIAVTVVDARLGGPSTLGGHIVTHLSLDIEVRSATDIDLTGQGPDNVNNWINVSPDTVSTIGVQPEESLRLPMHLAGGSQLSYRLEVPIEGLTWTDVPISGREPIDKFTTGPWTVLLSLYGAHPYGTPEAIYRTSISFIVPDRP